MSSASFPGWVWINFKVGALSVGAASRTVLYEEEVVTRRHWLSPDEFQEALTLSQILPGPNLVNLAACLGYRLFPAPSAMLAVLPLVLPGAVLVVLIALWVPLDNPRVAELFRGFAIGSFLLMGRFLWNLWRGLRAGGVSRHGGASRYFLALAMTALCLAGVPVLPMVGAGALVCIGWEFLYDLCAAFLIFLKIGLISFGGTFGLLPALQKILVEQHHWLTADQFVQSYVVGSFVPGPNMAMTSLVGYRIAGVPGAIACALGIYSGPILAVGLGCAYYYRNRGKSWVRRTEIALRPLVFALILSSSALFLRQQLGAQWMLGVVVGAPFAWLDWNRKLGALSCIFLAGATWWVCATGSGLWMYSFAVH